MIYDVIGITAIILVLLVIVLYYKSALDKDPEEEDIESIYTLSYLTNAVAKAFADSQKKNLKEMNLSKRELEAEKRKKQELRTNLKNAAYGDPNAKKYVKSFIKSILQDEAFGINPETINSVIPFNQPRNLDTRSKVDILFHIYYNEYGDIGFQKMVLEYGLNKPKPITREEEKRGKIKYNITREDIEAVYDDVMNKYTLSYDDKLEIVTQRIFADYKGFGVIDMLFDFSIDEVEGGVNGIAKGFLEIKNKHEIEGFEYTYDSIYIVFKGVNIKMGCMSFGSQSELVRVCKNIYKFQTAHALSRNQGHVVATMRDGSRVAVARPPEANSWTFCVRKFDSVSTTPTLEELFPQKNSVIPITIIKHIMYTQRSIFITGGMGTGKTTTLKGAVGYIPSEKNIRLFEISPELNLQNSFPQRNIVSFSVTESTTMQQLYDFGKKFNANVNIVSETASAEMGVITIESGRVGSEQAITTHHGTTTDNTITAFRDNLTTAGGYSDEAAAEEVVVNAFNFDIHMGRIGSDRFIERITEIIPIRDRRYPAEKNVDAAFSDKDTLEYYKRSTDRKSYEVRDVCVYDPESKTYIMKNPISEGLFQIMCDKLTDEAREVFIQDMQTLNSTIA